jgi:hypothetical protein
MSSENPSTPPPADSLQSVAEVHEKLDRIVTATASISLHVAQAIRMMSANQTLDARNRMALTDTVDKFLRGVKDVNQTFDRFKREPSMAMVRDVPVPRHVERENSGRSEDWSMVDIPLPLSQKKMRIPSRVLWGSISGALGAIGAWVLQYLSNHSVHP